MLHSNLNLLATRYMFLIYNLMAANFTTHCPRNKTRTSEGGSQRPFRVLEKELLQRHFPDRNRENSNDSDDDQLSLRPDIKESDEMKRKL